MQPIAQVIMSVFKLECFIHSPTPSQIMSCKCPLIDMGEIRNMLCLSSWTVSIQLEGEEGICGCILESRPLSLAECLTCYRVKVTLLLSLLVIPDSGCKEHSYRMMNGGSHHEKSEALDLNPLKLNTVPTTSHSHAWMTMSVVSTLILSYVMSSCVLGAFRT